jgi:hypothetical protein
MTSWIRVRREGQGIAESDRGPCVDGHKRGSADCDVD